MSESDELKPDDWRRELREAIEDAQFYDTDTGSYLSPDHAADVVIARVEKLLAEKDATIAQLREKITYWQSQCSGLDAELSKARARIKELERSDD
jgi:hypothetical protein